MDRVRLLFPYFVQPEEHGGYWSGIEVNLTTSTANVITVAANSPAARAGIKVNDVITSVAGITLHTGVDWLLALDGRKRGEKPDVIVARAGKTQAFSLELSAYPLLATVPADNKAPGLHYAVHQGDWQLLGSLHRLAPTETGTVKALSMDLFKNKYKENFLIEFTGYFEIPIVMRSRKSLQKWFALARKSVIKQSKSFLASELKRPL